MRPVCSTPLFKGFLGGSVVRNLPAMLETQGTGSVSGSGRSPGGGHGTPLVLSPGESHGQRSLAGCSPQGHTDLGTTELAHCLNFCMERKKTTVG